MSETRKIDFNFFIEKYTKSEQPGKSSKRSVMWLRQNGSSSNKKIEI